MTLQPACQRQAKVSLALASDVSRNTATFSHRVSACSSRWFTFVVLCWFESAECLIDAQLAAIPLKTFGVSVLGWLCSLRVCATSWTSLVDVLRHSCIHFHFQLIVSLACVKLLVFVRIGP